jgi:hypothetical protein
MSLRPEQIAEANYLRSLSPPWGFDKIACILGMTQYRLRCEIDPGYKEQREKKTKEVYGKVSAERKKRAPYVRIKPYAPPSPRRDRYIGKTLNHVSSAMDIPRDVLIDRDMRALLDHPTFTAAHCGDPKPGYSALHTTAGRRPLYERLKA